MNSSRIPAVAIVCVLVLLTACEEQEPTLPGPSSDAAEDTRDGGTDDDGGPSDGETTDGETTDGETTDGETPDGETTDGETDDPPVDRDPCEDTSSDSGCGGDDPPVDRDPCEDTSSDSGCGGEVEVCQAGQTACDPATLEVLLVCTGPDDFASARNVFAPIPCPGRSLCEDPASGQARCGDVAWPSGVRVIELDDAGLGTATVNFAEGMDLSSLGWASNPEIACWDNPAIMEPFFSNQHLAFGLADTVPAWSDVTIELTPASNAEANLYVLQQELFFRAAPPEIDAAYCSMPTTFGSIGAPTSYTFRVYEPTDVFWGVANRGRNRGDDDTDVEVSVRVTPVDPAERCYADAAEPGQFPPHVQRIELDEEGHWVGSGELGGGARVCGDGTYLDDAFCVPATQLDRFAGSQQFYAVRGGMPEASVLTITVTPDPGVDISLYGAQQGLGTGFRVPPLFPTTLCESSLRYSGVNPGEAESITFVSTTNPYEVFFAVAATSEQGDVGGYTVSVDLQTSPSDRCEDADYDAVRGLDEWPDFVTRVDASSGRATVAVDTRDGAPLCTLDWASSSQTACFPATEFFNFAGNAQLFALDPPPPAGSTVVARVVPERDVDVSLVGWSTSVERFVVPPYMPTVGVCEAAYARGIGDTTNPGVSEEILFSNPPTGNPYNYAFAVAGPALEELAGPAELQIEVFVPPPPSCPESLPGATYATWPSTVEQVTLTRESPFGSTGVVRGNLSSGSCTNLDWADQSSVACFPATRFDRFDGSHVQYALAEPMPPRSELTITLTPTDGGDVNLYGLQTGATRYPVPPAITGAIACEASYPGEIGRATNPGESEQIFFSNPTDNPYNITFVAAGPGSEADAAYEIDIELRESVMHCSESLGRERLDDGWDASVLPLTIDPATGEGTVSGSLGDGACTNLDFASASDVACFPATRNDLFEGSHTLVALSEPMPPNSVLTITLQPDADVDLNLYGLQTGASVYPLPPDVPGAISCEASYGPAFVPGVFGDPANPGEPEAIRFFNPTDNPYNVLLGVAGPRGVESGSFTLTAVQEVSTEHCVESLPGASYDAWPSFVSTWDLSEGELTIEGELDRGSCTNLDWADDSPNACFPATLFENFEGNHVFHAIEGAPGPGGTVRVTLEAGDGMRVYGYQISAGRFPLPPAVAAVLACEYALDGGEMVFTNPGDNPYQLLLGVAGAAGVEAGTYRLRVVQD